MLKKLTKKLLIPLGIFLISCITLATLPNYQHILGLGAAFSRILIGLLIATGLSSLLTFLVLLEGDYVNLSEVDTYIETQGRKVIINPLPKEYSFEHGVGTPSPDAQARTILVFEYDSTFERGYLRDHKGFSYKLGQADSEYLLKKTRKDDQNG